VANGRHREHEGLLERGGVARGRKHAPARVLAGPAW
jgi:hypothetical protein